MQLNYNNPVVIIHDEAGQTITFSMDQTENIRLRIPHNTNRFPVINSLLYSFPEKINIGFNLLK